MMSNAPGWRFDCVFCLESVKCFVTPAFIWLPGLFLGSLKSAEAMSSSKKTKSHIIRCIYQREIGIYSNSRDDLLKRFAEEKASLPNKNQVRLNVHKWLTYFAKICSNAVMYCSWPISVLLVHWWNFLLIFAILPRSFL